MREELRQKKIEIRSEFTKTCNDKRRIWDTVYILYAIAQKKVGLQNNIWSKNNIFIISATLYLT